MNQNIKTIDSRLSQTISSNELANMNDMASIFAEDPGASEIEAALTKEFSSYNIPLPASSRTLTHWQSRILSDLQISVGVELGSLSFSAEQILDLLPGQTFEFSFDPEQAVNLCVGEEIVATAEFVMQNEALALRILSVGSLEDLPIAAKNS